jgi:hypothetical protein
MSYKGRHTGRPTPPVAAPYSIGQAAVPWVRAVDEMEDTVPMADPWQEWELSWPPVRLEASA